MCFFEVNYSLEDPLKEGMATHSSILAWRTPWTEEPSELWSIGSQRVEHDWSIWTQKAHTGIISNFTLNMRFVRNESKELGVWKKGGGIQPVMIYWAFITRGQKWNETEISAIRSHIPLRSAPSTSSILVDRRIERWKVVCTFKKKTEKTWASLWQLMLWIFIICCEKVIWSPRPTFSNWG